MEELATSLGVDTAAAKDLLAEVDQNKDGLITYDEFKACWNKENTSLSA